MPKTIAFMTQWRSSHRCRTLERIANGCGQTRWLLDAAGHRTGAERYPAPHEGGPGRRARYVILSSAAQHPTQHIGHAFDAANRGDVFCSLLALVLQEDLVDRCRHAGITVEQADQQF